MDCAHAYNVVVVYSCSVPLPPPAKPQYAMTSLCTLHVASDYIIPTKPMIKYIRVRCTVYYTRSCLKTLF